jgi:hypothetical protein
MMAAKKRDVSILNPPSKANYLCRQLIKEKMKIVNRFMEIRESGCNLILRYPEYSTS